MRLDSIIPGLQEASNTGITLSKLSSRATKILGTVINRSGADSSRSVFLIRQPIMELAQWKRFPPPLMLELVRSKKWSTIRSISYLYEKYILCKSYPRAFGLHPSILSTWICYISRSVYHRHNFGSLLLRFVHFILATDTTMNNKYKGREISFPINVKIPFARNPFRSKSLRFSRFPFVLGQPSVRFMAKSW